MHTIEGAVLVPLGLGLIGILLMLTFFLHDQTVLTAEYSTFMLEWQSCPEGWEEKECTDRTALWNQKLFITEVQVLDISAGNNLCSLQTKEQYQLFDRVLSMMDQSFGSGDEVRSRVLLKVNPCWLKRIWKVVEGE